MGVCPMQFVLEEIPVPGDEDHVSCSESECGDVDSAYQSQVDKLENRVRDLEQLRDVLPMPATQEVKRSFDWKELLKTLGSIAALLVFVGGIIGWAHSELSKIDDRIVGIDKRMARLETAIRILSVGQGV